jgi:phosphatidylserine decarboxylase
VPLWLWVVWFFRDPDRPAPAEEGVFLSPADGVVTDVTAVGPDGELGTDGVKVGVFMSLFNVHVNRAPCDGRVVSIEHRRGIFLDARDSEAGLRNESAAIRLAHDAGGRSHPIVVRQVAGLIARRIITDLAEGQTVRRGERIGMIKFGSRLELLVPRELVGEVRVAVGDKAVAGRTVLVAAPEESGNETGPAD